MIDELERQPETQDTREGYEEDKDEVRVNAGYKATLKSELLIYTGRERRADRHGVDPNVSEEAKEHARDYLEERDAL